MKLCSLPVNMPQVPTAIRACSRAAMVWWGRNQVSVNSGPWVRTRTSTRCPVRLVRRLVKVLSWLEVTSPTMVSISPSTGVATSLSSVVRT